MQPADRFGAAHIRASSAAERMNQCLAELCTALGRQFSPQETRPTVNCNVLTEHQQTLASSDDTITKSVESAATTETALVAEQKRLSEKLNEPQQKYQTYKQALKEWQTALEAIEGSETEPESLKGLQLRVAQINELPTKLAHHTRNIRQEDRRANFLSVRLDRRREYRPDAKSA
ncbi:hypothetical protein [Mesorhizobium sp. M0491]|uniref:hypothetical protein n=1 Tax=Mesorhizobium sp. M0491 TaxID=2956950 RepID=UPI00333C28CC